MDGVVDVHVELWLVGDKDAHAHNDDSGGEWRHAVPVAERHGKLRLGLLPGRVRSVDVGGVVELHRDVRQRHAIAVAHGDD